MWQQEDDGCEGQPTREGEGREGPRSGRGLEEQQPGGEDQATAGPDDQQGGGMVGGGGRKRISPPVKIPRRSPGGQFLSSLNVFYVKISSFTLFSFVNFSLQRNKHFR